MKVKSTWDFVILMLKSWKSVLFATVFCFVLGLSFTWIFKLEKFTRIPTPRTTFRTYSNDVEYQEEEFTQFLMRTNVSVEIIQNETSDLPRKEELTFIDAETTINRSIAIGLKTKVRIVCWIVTRPNDIEEKLKAIKTTWGKRCNKLLFLSSADNNETGTIGLENVNEGWEWVWAKTKQALKYIHAHHLARGEWFLRADDDTFVIMENLRFMLSAYDPMEPLYFGCRFKDGELNNTEGYMSGGAGYVLSKESVRRFVEMGVDNPNLCGQQPNDTDDLQMGRCLAKVGVKGVDTRDNLDLHRFLPFSPGAQLTLNHSSVPWYWNKTYYPQKLGFQCCSDFVISFHDLSYKDQYVLEFFIYHFKLFGVAVAHRLQTDDILTKTDN